MRTLSPLLLMLFSALACSDRDARMLDGSVPRDLGATDARVTEDPGASDAEAIDATTDAAASDGIVTDDAAPHGPGDASTIDAEADAGQPDAPNTDAATRDSGTADDAPITAPDGAWTWVDFPGSRCDEGSATGIGVNLNPASRDVLVFLMGGGACWDYQTCFVLDTSTHGPFGRTQFDFVSPFLSGVADRNNSQNPFREFNLVFVPYCTGDIHGGDNEMSYLDPSGNPHVVHHKGHANVAAFVRRLVPTIPSPGRLVLSGSSAGGFGALINYSYVRTAWAPEKMYLIDDSGPTFVEDDINSSLRSAWYTSWRLDRVLDPVCGAACRTDMARGMSAIAAAYPNDRLALLSSLQDSVIAGYFQVTGPTFETSLRRVASEVLDPTASFEYFFVPGSTHTMLGNPGSYVSNGTPLLTWLERQLSDDPAWDSTSP